jgi:hypothetical protein
MTEEEKTKEKETPADDSKLDLSKIVEENRLKKEKRELQRKQSNERIKRDYKIER